MHAAWRKRAGEAEAELEIRRINAKEAVRILSAVEFDGQAYDAITAAIKLIDRSAVTVGASKC
jgi:hypothetical protein